MELFKQINYEALNEDARLKKQIRDRTFQQVAAFTQSAAEQIKPAYGVDAQNTFDKIYNNFGAVLARAVDDYLINDNRINASDVIQSYNNLSSFINSKMGFKDLTLTQRDYVTQKMNAVMPQVGVLLRNAQAADYTDKFEMEQLLNQLRSKTYNTVGYAPIRPEFLDLRGLIKRVREIISLLEKEENVQFFEAGEQNIIQTSIETVDGIEGSIFDNTMVTGALKRQFDLKQRSVLESLIRTLGTQLGSIENRKALVKKSIKEYTDYQYNLSQLGRNATVLAESEPKLLEKIRVTNQKLNDMVQAALVEPYRERTQTLFSKTLKEGLSSLSKAEDVYKRVVKQTVFEESPKAEGALALPRNMQAINAFRYANENPDPEFAAETDNIIIQNLGPTPEFKIKRKRISKKMREAAAREAQAVPAAEPAVGRFGEPLDEPMIGEGLRSHPSYRKTKMSDDINPYLRMFAR
jgi:hypothetical protein